MVKFKAIEQNRSFKILMANANEGEVMKTHVADKDAYLHVFSGAVRFKLDESVEEIGPSMGMHIPAGKAHSFEVTQPAQLMLTLDSNVKLQFI